MRAFAIRTGRRRGQAGISLIELMIAGIILVVGLLALMVLIITAIGTNNRNKNSTTATLIAQQVLQAMATQPANSTGTARVTDCGGTTWTVAVAPGGATLSGSEINFHDSTVTNYHMDYVVCTGNATATYDVRWNVQLLTTNTSLVIVSVQQRGATSDLRQFALPTTLRTIMGA